MVFLTCADNQPIRLLLSIDNESKTKSVLETANRKKGTL